MANSYLNRTQTAGTSTRKFTYSVWMKRSSISTSGNYNSGFFNCWGDANNRLGLYFYDNKLYLYGVTGGSANISVRTNRLFRDTSAWYHIVLAVDTTQGTAADRIKIYVNGVQETSLDQTTYPAQNFDFPTVGVNAKAIEIGRVNFGDQSTYYYMDGYLSHAAFVDGLQLTPTSFGETDSTSGIWKFKSPSGITWGNNGFHLKMENSAALGTDSSGNSNTFTVNGNLKQALDTPSNVYATYNSLNPNNPDFSNGNNTLTRSSNSWKPAWTTIGASSGKYYCEMDWDSGSNFTVGFSTADVPGSNPALDDIVGNPSNGGYLTVLYDNGVIYNNGSSAGAYGSGSSYTTGDIMMLAMDLDNNKFYFGKNGTWFNSANPANNTGGYDINASYTNSTWCFTACVYGTGSWHGNFGNGFFGTTAITSAGSNGNGSLFEYDVPSGYYALNTKNINTYG